MVDLTAKVAFLGDPAAYDGEGGAVEMRETHMSWVFLTAARVHKLKKPVRYPHLDFSTIERRRFFCGEEVRLNRDLAPGVYLGVRALRQGPAGLTLSGPGRVVDWLVEMVRLPEDEMLEARIRGGRLDPTEIEAVGARLARWYAGLPGDAAAAEPYLRHLRTMLALDRATLTLPDLTLGAEPALAAAEVALDRLAPEIAARARRGMLVEGHGDLRPQHVCLTEPPQIFDRLEFDRIYRLADPYDEVGRLGLESRVLGAEWIGPQLLAALDRRLGDPPSAELTACYGALAALTRARLSIAHLLERPVRTPPKWRPLARRYLAAAEAFALNRPAG